MVRIFNNQNTIISAEKAKKREMYKKAAKIGRKSKILLDIRHTACYNIRAVRTQQTQMCS